MVLLTSVGTTLLSAVEEGERRVEEEEWEAEAMPLETPPATTEGGLI